MAVGEQTRKIAPPGGSVGAGIEENIAVGADFPELLRNGAGRPVVWLKALEKPEGLRSPDAHASEGD